MSEVQADQLQAPTAEQHRLADLLLSLASTPQAFRKHADKKSYITLDHQLGKSARNKNAVCIHRSKGKVSFMVADWSSSARAKELNLTFEQLDNPKIGKRLSIINVKEETVHAHSLFFREMLGEAEKESGYRQSRKADLA